MSGRSASLLPWIVAFKAFKAILLTALGLAVLSAIHRGPVDFVVQMARTVHLPATSRLFDRAVTLAMHVTPKNEVALAATAFGYAALMGIEGVGLYLRQTWARWFTIGATSTPCGLSRSRRLDFGQRRTILRPTGPRRSITSR